MDFMAKAMAFVKAIVKFLQDLVTYFRAQNEGKDAEFPKFDFSFGESEESQESTTGA